MNAVSRAYALGEKRADFARDRGRLNALGVRVLSQLARRHRIGSVPIRFDSLGISVRRKLGDRSVEVGNNMLNLLLCVDEVVPDGSEDAHGWFRVLRFR